MLYIDELINLYIQTPPISISGENLAKYVLMLNHNADKSLREYSECRPLYKEKQITTAPDQTTINIYQDIDENFMDFIIFDELENIQGGFFIPELQYYITPMLLDQNQSIISFLNIQTVYDNIYMIKEYFQTKGKLYIFNGAEVKCKPNTTYYVLYEKYRTREELYPQDYSDYEDLFKVNLMINMIDSFFFTEEQPIRSVSISGISVSFNVENKESVRRNLFQIKDKVKNKICNIYEFVERF